jgi:hypothetical protein
VNDLIAVATVLRSLADVQAGSFRRLFAALPSASQPTTPRVEIFDGMPGTRGAGASVSLSAKRSDARRVVWLVEVWIDTWDTQDTWQTIVKGEIDIDDDDGNDECELNIQRQPRSADEAAAAITELARLVLAHEVEGL